MSQKKLLVLSSGGDAPGMNAAIRSVVRCGLHYKMSVYGCELGFQGLVNGAIFAMQLESVANCIQRGGTILKTARCETFRQPDVQQRCRDFLKKEGVNAIIVIGGNGSFQGALRLAEDQELQVIGIPCTIDNDINGTDYCVGFDTACNTAIESIDRIRDTALSHERNFIIEVMGRSSGFLAVDVGLAGGAEFILIPEAPISVSDLVQKIKNKKRHKLTSIIVAAEADCPGHTASLAAQIKELSGIDYKTCILGHTQRGGSPTARDRVLATLMGGGAIEAILAGESHKMVANVANQYTLVELPDPEHAIKYFDKESLLKINHMVSGIE